MYMAKIKQLEDTLEKTVKKYRQLDERRKHEVDGLKRDLKMLMDRMKPYSVEQTVPTQQKENKKPINHQLTKKDDSKTDIKKQSERTVRQQKKH